MNRILFCLLTLFMISCSDSNMTTVTINFGNNNLRAAETPNNIEYYKIYISGQGMNSFEKRISGSSPEIRIIIPSGKNRKITVAAFMIESNLAEYAGTSWADLSAGDTVNITIVMQSTLRMVTDLKPGSEGSEPTQAAVFENNIYFHANGNECGKELWVYNTDAKIEAGINPQMIADINPGESGSGIEMVTVINNKLYFTGTNGSDGNELWTYDPTIPVSENNPVMVANLNTSTGASSYPSDITQFGDKICFIARGGNDTVTYDNEVWVYDPDSPATEGKNPIMISNHNNNFDLLDLIVIKNNIYTVMHNNLNEVKLWESDGVSLTEVTGPNFFNTAIDPYLTEFNDKLFFIVSNENSERELWVYDGTTSPKIVHNINNEVSAEVQNLILANNNLYFSAMQAEYGNEFWSYNDSGANPALVDINTNPETGSDPHNFNEINGYLYFIASDGTIGLDKTLWTIPPTSENAIKVPGITFADSYENINGKFLAIKDYHFFVKQYTNSSSEYYLMKYDTRHPDKAPVNIMASYNFFGISLLCALDNKLYFQYADKLPDSEIWVYEIYE